MFTGIVEAVGIVVACSKDQLVIHPQAPMKGRTSLKRAAALKRAASLERATSLEEVSALGGLNVGESVSVDGVCLTVEKIQQGQIFFGLLPETLRVSTLGTLRQGTKVNLERALRLGSRLGGHLLLGHVDGQGTVVGRFKRGRGVALAIEVPESLAPFLVPKGPIGVDGVSLTLAAVSNSATSSAAKRPRFQVHLISHTLKATTLANKTIGQKVNLEADLIAKYLFRML